MPLKFERSILFVFVFGLVSFFSASEGVPQGTVVSFYRDFSFDFYDRFVQFGDLRANGLYEILYDGQPTMMMKADEAGGLSVPVPPHNYHVEARQYVHSESTVDLWYAYD